MYVDGRRIEATKLDRFPEAAPESNTFRARLELPENAADLYPGMFVKVAFVIGEAERLLVPADALVERSEITAVYVQAARRPDRLCGRFASAIASTTGSRCSRASARRGDRH